jgi:F-box/WD-40 domain protein MET30
MDGTIKIWSFQDFSCIKTLEAQPDGVVCLSFYKKILACGSVDGTIKVWDLSVGCIFNLPGHSVWTNCIQIINKDTIISSSDDNTLKIWDLNSRELVHSLSGHTGYFSRIN